MPSTDDSTTSQPASRLTIAAMLDRVYRNYPDNLAVRDARRSLTHRAFAEEVRRLAATMASWDLQAGDRVAIATANRTEFFVAEHALFRSGLVRVGLSPKAHVTEVLFVVQDSGAKLLFVDAHWKDLLRQHRSELGDTRIICFDEPEYTNATSQSITDTDGYVPQPDDVAALLYTSGSTGLPKGAVHTQRSIAAIARNHLTEIQPIDESDLVLHIGPLAHMSGVFSWAFFAKGAGHHIVDSFDPAAILRLIDEEQVTALLLVPTMLNRLTAAAKDVGYHNRTVRTIMYGASPIAPDKLAQAIDVFGDVFVQAYGQSEGQLVSALSRAGHRASPTGSLEHLASAGRPSPFVEVRIIDDAGNALPVAEEGEIAIRSDTVMTGYFDRPDETEEVFLPGGWLRTGDVGRLSADGFLYITDRRRDMIVSGGYNVYPAEVEHAISQVPGVFEVAVVGAPDEVWGEAVTAVVQCTKGANVDPDEIIQACRRSLAAYKIPKRVVFSTDLPKTPVGKISRRDVRERFWQGQSRRVG